MIFCGFPTDRGALLTTFADTVIRARQTPFIDLPSSPVLTSIRVLLCIFGGEPSGRIVNILSSISSTPALAFVDIQCGNDNACEPTPSDEWDDLDKWLARVAQHITAERSLALTLRRWLFSESSWEALLPRFREAGGKIKTRPDGYDE